MKLPIVLFGLLALGGAAMCGSLVALALAAPPAPVAAPAPSAPADGWPFLPLLGLGAVALLLLQRRDEKHGEYQVAMRQAAHPPAPTAHILHWHAPEPGRLPAAGKIAPLLPGPEPTRILETPTARALLAQGLIGPGRPMVFCWTAAGPVLGGPDQIFTTGVGGKGRSGKTRTAAWLIGQRVMHGARVLGIDPHQHKADSLSRLLAPLASAFVLPLAGWQVDAMDRVITQAEAFLEALRRGETLGPLLLVIDEYTLLMRQQSDLARRAARLVEAVATEGGGLDFHGLVIGQNWKGTRAGGTEVREMLNSAFVHRSWERQAGYLVPDADLAKAAESLVPGRAIFVPTDDDPQAVGIPLVEMADLAQMWTLARGGNGYPSVATEAARIHAIDDAPTVVDFVQYRAATTTTTTPYATTSPPKVVVDAAGSAVVARRAQIRDLLHAKASNTAIINEVWGNPKGRDFMTASRELTGIIADLIP